MPKLPKELSEWLGKFGIDQKSLMRIRFGGVVGKQALVGVLGVAGIVYVASRAGANGTLLAGCLIGIFVLTVPLKTWHPQAEFEWPGLPPPSPEKK